jgi:hypothetical protein
MDGQPFGRVVVVPDLAQGPEAVPATPRGQIARGWAMDESGRYIVPSGHRFSYTLTVESAERGGLKAHGGSCRLSAYPLTTKSPGGIRPGRLFRDQTAAPTPVCNTLASFLQVLR